jgi:hypothetical protein
MNPDDNNSTRKLGIEVVVKPDGAKWIDVLLLKYGPPHPRFRPSFLDLHRILQALAVCEDEKYPWPQRGRHKLADFLRDAVVCRDFNKLAARYNIPERDRDVVVNPNGAKLSPPTLESEPTLPLTADDIRWGLK